MFADGMRAVRRPGGRADAEAVRLASAGSWAFYFVNPWFAES
jgi:hypothetical protein